MGMFDTIIPHKDFPLPLPKDLGELTAEKIHAQTFQTKDLESCLTIYEIDADGSVFRLPSQWETPSDDKKRLLGPQSFVFYCYISDDTYKNDYILDWLYCYDTDPLKRQIKLIHFEKIDNSERKARQKEAKDKAIKREKLLSRGYMRFYCFYRRCVRIIFRYYRIVKNKLPSNFDVEQWLTPL